MKRQKKNRPLKRLNINNAQHQGKMFKNTSSNQNKQPSFLDALMEYKNARRQNIQIVPSTSKDNQENQASHKNYQSVTVISDNDLEDGEIIEDQASQLASIIADSIIEINRSKQIEDIKSPESAKVNQSVFYVDKSSENGSTNVPLYNSLSDISDEIMEVEDSVICIDTTQSNSDDSEVIVIDDNTFTPKQTSDFISLSPIRPNRTKAQKQEDARIRRKERQKRRLRVYRQRKMIKKVIELQTNGLLEGMPIKIPLLSTASVPSTSHTQTTSINQVSTGLITSTPQPSTSQSQTTEVRISPFSFCSPASEKPREKRIILIDGSNVALSYTSSAIGNKAMVNNHNEFSAEALQKVITYFEKKNFQVKAIVPEFRVRREKSSNHALMTEMMNNGKLITTPSKSYDDLILLESAAKLDAAIVSNDLFRDVRNNSKEFKEVTEKRQIRYNWVFGELILAEDPYGRSGPKLDDILHKKT